MLLPEFHPDTYPVFTAHYLRHKIDTLPLIFEGFTSENLPHDSCQPNTSVRHDNASTQSPREFNNVYPHGVGAVQRSMLGQPPGSIVTRSFSGQEISKRKTSVGRFATSRAVPSPRGNGLRHPSIIVCSTRGSFPRLDRCPEDLPTRVVKVWGS
jgi:hypothetical protein